MPVLATFLHLYFYKIQKMTFGHCFRSPCPLCSYRHCPLSISSLTARLFGRCVPPCVPHAIVKSVPRTLFFNVNEPIPKSVRRKIRRRGAGSGQSAPRDAIMHRFTDSWSGAAYAGEKICLGVRTKQRKREKEREKWDEKRTRGSVTDEKSRDAETKDADRYLSKPIYPLAFRSRRRIKIGISTF